MSEALKRLLAKKKAAEAAAAQTEQPAPVSAPAQNSIEEKKDDTKHTVDNPELILSDGTNGSICDSNSELHKSETDKALLRVSGSDNVVPGHDNSADKPASSHPLAMEMAQLEQALNNNVPDFANKLREIHIKLRNDPHIVTLLSDEEIGVIVGGLEKHTNIQIVSPKTKSASGRKALLAGLSASDL